MVDFLLPTPAMFVGRAGGGCAEGKHFVSFVSNNSPLALYIVFNQMDMYSSSVDFRQNVRVSVCLSVCLCLCLCACMCVRACVRVHACVCVVIE